MEHRCEYYIELALTCERPQLTQHLPHASPPSSPLATIHDLPLETIERVVNTAYSVTRAGGSAFAVSARTTFLLATSLVCRVWTPVAQRELYRNVCIGSKSSSYDSFVAAGPGRYTVETLVLNASGVSADVVSFVLSNVRGVTNLTLVYGQVGADCLNGDNLKGTSWRPSCVGIVYLTQFSQTSRDLSSVARTSCPHSSSPHSHSTSRRSSSPTSKTPHRSSCWTPSPTSRPSFPWTSRYTLQCTTPSIRKVWNESLHWYPSSRPSKFDTSLAGTPHALATLSETALNSST
jgi:hypothetical protein